MSCRGGQSAHELEILRIECLFWPAIISYEDREVKRYMNAFGFFWCTKEQGVRDHTGEISQEAPRGSIHRFSLTQIPLLDR